MWIQTGKRLKNTQQRSKYVRTEKEQAWQLKRKGCCKGSGSKQEPGQRVCWVGRQKRLVSKMKNEQALNTQTYKNNQLEGNKQQYNRITQMRRVLVGSVSWWQIRFHGSIQNQYTSPPRTHVTTTKLQISCETKIFPDFAYCNIVGRRAPHFSVRAWAFSSPNHL